MDDKPRTMLFHPSLSRLLLVIGAFSAIFLLHGYSATSQDRSTVFKIYGDLSGILHPDTVPRLVVDNAGRNPDHRNFEGPSWLNGVLYFSDQPGGYHALYPDKTWKRINDAGWTCGSTPLPNGNMAVCYIVNRSIVEMTPAGEIIGVIADSFEGAPFSGNPNDCITDNRGGLYFTVNLMRSENSNEVFYLGPDGTLTQVIPKGVYAFPNGCVLSPDGDTFYLSDSGTFTIWAYTILKDGTLADPRPFAELTMPPGQKGEKPKGSAADGMTVDAAGRLYVASVFGIQVFGTDGSLIGGFTLPRQPTHCCFGGTDLSTLFVTCRQHIYALETTVKGLQYPLGERPSQDKK